MFLCDVDIRDIQLKRENLRSRGFKKTSFPSDTCFDPTNLEEAKEEKEKGKGKNEKMSTRRKAKEK